MVLRFLLRWTRRFPVTTCRRRQLGSGATRLSVECLETRRLLATAHPFHIIVAPSDVAPLSTAGPTGYTPSQIRHAYGFDQITYLQQGNTVPGDGRGQTIAIVDAYDDPTAFSDLQKFDQQFGLPDPVFTKVNQNGGSTLPSPDSSWSQEIALDVEWAHAIAPAAKILLVEATSNSLSDLTTGVQYAARQPGVVAVSMSWGGAEFATDAVYDSAFNSPGVVFVASSGDSGAPVGYPAISPNVLAVGGTSLTLSGQNYASEAGWSGSGGGISAYALQPVYQLGVVTQSATKRTNPDVAYDSDPATGFPVCDSYSFGSSKPWAQFGGTSAAAPQWAALVAIADQGRAVNGAAPLSGASQLLPLIYQMPASNFHDIASGTSTGIPPYSAGPGYDLVTGRGSPYADRVVNGLVGTVPSDLTWSASGDGITGPANAAPQTAFTITAQYTVSGGAVASDFTIGYYASTSSDPNQNLANATLLGTQTITAAADKSVGDHTTTSPNLMFPSAGTYYLLARLDGGNAIPESDETNNVVAAATATVVQGQGDVIIDNGHAGYSETGSGWFTSSSLPSYGGDYRGHDAAGGADTAVWQAGGLASANYDVEVTWTYNGSRTNSASYQVFDGATLLQTVTVNQQVAPSGPTVGGVVFQSLGSYHIGSGTLKVVLSDSGNGYIIADAMRAAPLQAPTLDLNWLASGDGITGPTNAAPQTAFTITAQYTISGAAVTSDFTIGYYASTSSDPNQNLANATLLGTQTITAAADKSVGNHTTTSPNLMFPGAGTYYLLARLDGGDAIPETDETNNVVAAATATVVQGQAAVIIDNGHAGYSETGSGWFTSSNAPSYGGDYRVHDAAGGADTAVWQAGGLASGNYDVEVTWTYNSSRTNSASYQIFDGANLLQTVTVNQQLAPSGTTVGGFVFQSLGSYHIGSGTLKVVLSDLGNGYIIADAMRAAPLQPATLDLNWSAPGDGITGPTNVAPQTAFTMTAQYTISGAAVTSDFTIGYYASTSSDPNQNLANATLLGTQTITAAADKSVGNHTTTSPNLTFPSAGTYYLLARLDGGNAIPESDETNNVVAAATATVVQGQAAVIIDNGHAGYSETGSGWFTSSNAPSYGGDYRVHDPAGGADTAVWQAGGLASGNYDVEVTWTYNSSRTNSASYQVFDGATLLQTVTVNQQLAPSGTTVGGVVFQSLGSYHIGSGTLKVVLSDLGNGYIIADAMRAAPV